MRKAARPTTKADETPEFLAFWEGDGMPSQLTLRECFAYDEETGLLTWRQRPRSHFTTAKSCGCWNARYAGTDVKAVTHGYVRTSINKRSLYAHRLIWKMAYGESPQVIDHINGDGLDNRLMNLRSGSQKENTHNAAPRKHKIAGVYKHSRAPGWYAQVATPSGVKSKLFPTKEQAVQWRIEQGRAHGFSERHLGVA
jgi:hypothetical protein